MTSTSRHGATSEEVRTARRDINEAVTTPFFSSTVIFAPSTVYDVLDHSALPSKVATFSRNRSCFTTLLSMSDRTWLRTVSRIPAGFCFATVRYNVESETRFEIPSVRRAAAPRSALKSSARRNVIRVQANAAANSPRRP